MLADVNFHSESYQWLVVAGARAQYKGAGTFNGVPGYGFLLTAVDGQVNGGGGMDKFRIKIWDPGGVGVRQRARCPGRHRPGESDGDHERQHRDPQGKVSSSLNC